MWHEKIDEMLRERISGGNALEEVLALQVLTSLTSQQGGSADVNTLLPILMLLGGGGFGRRGRIDRFALAAMLLSQQSQSTSTVPGTSPPPTLNLLTLLLALGLFGDRDSPFGRFQLEGGEAEGEREREREHAGESEEPARSRRRQSQQERA
jgi:hypothetical protein